MPRKKQTKEEILEKAKLARRRRYAMIKSDPVKYAMEKEKEHQRYLKRKESKKIVSIQELTPRAKKMQRKRWRDNFRRHYQRKLLQKRGVELMNANTPSGSDTDDSSRIYNDIRQEPQEIPPDPIREQEPSNLILLKMKKKIRHLEYILLKKEKVHKLQIQDLEKKVDNYRKICQRLKKRLQSPNSKATRLIKDKTKVDEVKKKVLFGEAMKKTLEANYQGLQSNKDKKTFSETILKQKSILKEHKVLSETKNFKVRDKKDISKQDIYEKLKEDIGKFFDRDDVSRMTAGKKEYITRDKIKKQRRYLLDSMKNLHKIFEAENTKVSYSYFCKQRPFWVLIPDVSNRETCLCKIHANIELLIKVLHSRKILKEKDSKEVIDTICCANTVCLLKRCGTCKIKSLEYALETDEEISFSRWEYKKDTYISKGEEKEKRIIAKVKVKATPKEAIAELEKILPEFLKHEGTRRWQFTAMKDLKTNLKDNEAILHIDFSENYAFKYNAEVQSFHFGGSRKELTLHTAVIYFNENDKITCQSFCTVSENMRHDAAAVWAHIVPLLEYIMKTKNKVNYLHFLSDSPSSQYRNKTMFYIISTLHWYFRDLELVTWNFSEAGHGKGAADGVGGTIKRTADAAVAKGKDIVTLEDFMTTITQSTENIKLEIVNDYQIFEKDLLIPSEKLQTLKGTNKVHQVLWKKDNQDLIFRETSCFVCLSVACNHVKYIGKLNYVETPDKVVMRQENETKIQQDFDSKPKLVPVNLNKILLRKSPRKVTTRLRSLAKENIHITSNIVLKPATKRSNVTRLSDIKPDNKLHLAPDINISDMINLYNISNDDGNFSGVFENFITTRSTLQEELSDTEGPIEISGSRNTSLTPKRQAIFRSKKPSISSRQSADLSNTEGPIEMLGSRNASLTSKSHPIFRSKKPLVSSRQSADQSFIIDPPSSPTSQMTVTRNFGDASDQQMACGYLSSSDDEEIFSFRKKHFFD